jgi:phosphoesterase RecJ-like protein
MATTLARIMNPDMTKTSKTSSHTLQDVGEAIGARERFIVASHARPDGDAVGSQMAMALALEALGKQVTVVSADPPPEVCRALPGVDTIVIGPTVAGEWDAAIVMECGELARTGLAGLDGTFAINIDHHLGNTLYGDVNYFDESAAACGELVHDIIGALGVPLTAQIARHLYVAILTDTGSFHHGAISARTFDICSRLTAAGADPAALAHQMFDQYGVGRLKVLGAVLTDMRLVGNDGVAVLAYDDALLTRSGATLDDLEGLVNLPLASRTVQAVVLFKTAAGEPIRVSLRSKGDVDVRAVAGTFGGGGHRNAAGCTLESSAPDACDALVTRVVAAVNAGAATAGDGDRSMGT